MNESTTAPVQNSEHTILCRKCYYDLRGLATPRCPECGLLFNPADPKTYIGADDARRVRDVGLAQKLLIWAVVASILGWVVPFLFLLAIPFQLYCVYRLARANRNGIVVSSLLMLAMLLPLISLIVLLVLNQTATRTLRDAGYRVGFMGVKSSDLPPPIDLDG